MTQLDLFGEKVEWHSEKWKQHMQKVEEHNEKCEQARIKRREKGEHEVWSNVSFPCPVACKMPVEERPEHIRNCEECKQLERDLDRQLGFETHVWS